MNDSFPPPQHRRSKTDQPYELGVILCLLDIFARCQSGNLIKYESELVGERVCDVVEFNISTRRCRGRCIGGLEVGLWSSTAILCL